MSVLAVDRVTVDYGGVRALDDVTLEVPAHSVVGLIGPNGAGKTTLFDTVLGIANVTSGSVRLFGQDVTSWPMHRRARLGMARTFQRLELFGSLSVLENLIVAIESAPSQRGALVSELLQRPSSIDVRRRAHDRAAELLDLVGLSGHEETRAAALPMGHARLLELARALATDPKLLMLDEPSSGLNDGERAGLAALLSELRHRRDLSILIVEHDMPFVLGLSETVHVLDFGRLIATGPPDDVRRDPAVVAAYLGEEVTGARRVRSARR